MRARPNRRDPVIPVVQVGFCTWEDSEARERGNAPLFAWLRFKFALLSSHFQVKPTHSIQHTFTSPPPADRHPVWVGGWEMKR
jgi:hypothetical protein